MSERKDASTFTRQANAGILEDLPFNNREDFELARRGFIGTLPNMVIRDDAGNVVWDMEQYGFLLPDGGAPGTVNPSLWRQAKLNAIHGLFKVTDRIYQVRGFDLANITFIEGDTGWIVIDALTSSETATAALELVHQHLSKKPVVALIITHSHADHFAGVRGIVSGEAAEVSAVKIIAPDGFLKHAVSENIMVGNAMSRRALYMYGNLLPKGPRGQVDSGLGKTTSTGSVGLAAPTDIITETGQEMTVDGVHIVFQLTPGAEAPAEHNLYFPQFKALCMAENVSANLHNLLTPRGAEVRDALAWSKYINEAIELFGDKAEVVFGVHHWPRWGNEKILDWLKKQRDLYKYIHDETLRLANHGYTMIEIAEMIELPDSLALVFYNRGYYGTVNYNSKAVYQKYLGWFDGNPANLHPLPPVEAGRKYVEFMGGVDAVLAKARDSYDKGEYRWVAQVVNHIVFAEPENKEARSLQADALEQLGYRAEAGPWRNFYLTAAQELRGGVVPARTPPRATSDAVRAMSLDMFFDYLGVRLNGPKAAGITITINFAFTDTEQKYVLHLENAVLNYTKNRQAENADATVVLTRAVLDEIIVGQATFMKKLITGEITIKGRRRDLRKLFSLMDDFDLWFNIVTP